MDGKDRPTTRKQYIPPPEFEGGILYNLFQSERHLTYLPSRRYGILLAWISVICVKPISFTASRVLAETLAANDWKDVSVSMLAPTILPGTVTNIKNLISTIHYIKYKMC